MKKNMVYIFIIIGVIFMISTAIYLVNIAFIMNRTIYIISNVLFILSLCGLYFCQWKIYSTEYITDKKRLKVLKYFKVAKKIWLIFVLLCIFYIIFKALTLY